MDSIQENLIKHLCLYHVMRYQDCLYILDPYGLHTPIEQSYIFRPLTKQGYLKKRDNCVTVLAKGRALYPDLEPLVSVGGGKQNIERVMQVSRMAMLLGEHHIFSFGELRKHFWFYFIPSARWRVIAPGILSTTRFLGVLVAPDNHRYAIYDIDDGKIEWQARAEGSLFYTKHGSYETRATGMIFVCSERKRIEVAQQIIRQTMWYRKQLLRSDGLERDKPVRWSRAPIRLKADYQHVYLMTWERLRQGVMRLYKENGGNPLFCLNGERLFDRAQGDYEVWPYRFFCNSACDLLKYVYFFSAAKNLMEVRRTMPYVQNDLRYAICIRREDWPILKMYPDVLKMEGLTVYEYPD